MNRIFYIFFILNIFSINCYAKLGDRLKEIIIKKLESASAPDSNKNTSEILTKEGDYVFSYLFMEKMRMYKIHLPKNYSIKKSYPLLFAFHGGGGNMEHMSDDNKYKILSKSDEHGFVVVFPAGYSKLNSGKFATWNAGNCCGDARDLEIDDVGFIRDLFYKLKNQVSIDQNKVFATGMSNGGMFSYRVACELSDLFKAIASVAGTDNTKNCGPTKNISILHIHAKNDDHVLFDGGIGQSFSEERSKKITNFNSVSSTVNKWAEINHCKKIANRVLNVNGAYCDLYDQCENNSKVKLCVTSEGKHSWPIGKQFKIFKKASTAISANDIMWDFFDSI